MLLTALCNGVAMARARNCRYTKMLRIMRLTMILLTVGFLHVSGGTRAQKINLAVKNESLQNVFTSIKNQTGYLFFYSKEDLATAKLVTLELINSGLEDALHAILANEPLSFEIQGNTIFIRLQQPPLNTADNPSSSIEIHGRVIDSLGNPLVGASVTIKGSKYSVATDANGEFYLKNVAPNATIIVTNVGYEIYEIKLANNPVIKSGGPLNIKLKVKSSQLTDVDVKYSNGYQNISKERATGSFVQIDNALFNREVTTDVISRLDGIASSVFFDQRQNVSAPPITIRGISTLSAASATTVNPLIVLDNFPYDGDINNINPNDVESITILRDAAAASIWGARSGNGVIVITTKKGKFNQPAHLSINANVSVRGKPRLFSVSQITSTDFIDVEKSLFNNGFYDGSLSDPGYPVVSPVVEILNNERNGTITPDNANAQIDSLRKYDVRNDFLKYVYRNTVQQQYAANLSGGNANFNYFFSAGYDKDLSSLIGNQNNRITLHSQNIFKPAKNFELQFGILFTQTNGQLNNSGNFQPDPFHALYPYARLADSRGNPLETVKDNRMAWKDTVGNGVLLNWRYQPLSEIADADNHSKSNDVLINLGGKYNFTSFLSGEVRYQYENTTGSGVNNYSQQTYTARNLINLFTQVDPTDGTVTNPVPLGGILDQSNNSLISNDVRAQINYNQVISGKHTIVAVAGAEIRDAHISSNSHRTYGYNDNNITFVPVDYVNYFQSAYNPYFYSTIPDGTSFTDQTNRFVSGYCNASYTYENRYVISGSAREDASNLLGVTANNKWKPFWSTGVSWILSNESFYKSKLFPLLKIRVTYGYNGNVNNTISALTTLSYNSNISGISTLPFNRVISPPDNDLTWEKVGMTNLAVDFATKNNIFSGSLEYYHKVSTNVISGIPADPTIWGAAFLTKNSASLSGNGVDLILNAKVIGQRFKWDATVLLSWDKVIVSKYLFPVPPNTSVGDGNGISPIEGKTPYNIISFKFAGLDPVNGDPQGYINKQISKDYNTIINNASWQDLKISGSSIPQYFGAFRNTFSYRKFSLSINISYKLDYYFRRQTINYNDLYNSWTTNGDYYKRWQKPGDEKTTTVPSMDYPADPNRDQFYRFSEATVDRGDQIRLQDINLNYTFTNKNLKKNLFQNLEVYVYARDLGIIWKANKDSLDPDANGGIPVSRSIAFGCRVDF